MNWQAIGATGEVLGAIGVIATLVYLTLQIRQNTRATRAATFLGLTNAWQDYLLAWASADLTELQRRARFDPGSVTESEYVQLYSHARVLFRRFENDFFQYRSGTFDPGAWEGYRNSLTSEILASPSIRAFWEQQRFAFAPQFIAFIDELLVSAPRDGQNDLAMSVQTWKELVEKESAA